MSSDQDIPLLCSYPGRTHLTMASSPGAKEEDDVSVSRDIVVNQGSWTEIFKDYAQYTTGHGIRYLAEKSIVRR